MAVFDPPRFASKVHLNIKDDMTRALLPSWRRFLPSLQNLKCYSNITHFLVQSITPIGVAILLVKRHSLIMSCRQLDPILVGYLSHSRINGGYDRVTFTQGEINPPRKSGFIVNTARLGIFCHLDRIRFFHEPKVNPLPRRVIPLNE